MTFVSTECIDQPLANAHHITEVPHLIHTIADVFGDLEHARIILPVGVLRRLIRQGLLLLARGDLVGRQHARHCMAGDRRNLLRETTLGVLVRLSRTAARHDRLIPDVRHALTRHRVYKPLVIGRVCDSYHVRLVEMRVTSYAILTDHVRKRKCLMRLAVPIPR